MKHCISKAISDVFTYLGQTREDELLLTFPIDLVADQAAYQLPRTGQIRSLRQYNSAMELVAEWAPLGNFDLYGPGWRIEANTLVFQETPSGADAWSLEYVPSYDTWYHYGIDGSLNNDLDVFTLTDAPTLGQIDRTENSYVGQILRLLPTQGVIEERIIVGQTYDATNNRISVELRRPFTVATGAINSSSSSSGNVEGLAYEIVPYMGLMSAGQWSIAGISAMDLASNFDITQKRYEYIRRSYARSVKTFGDMVCRRQGRTGKFFDGRTLDNQAWYSFGI